MFAGKVIPEGQPLKMTPCELLKTSPSSLQLAANTSPNDLLPPCLSKKQVIPLLPLLLVLSSNLEVQVPALFTKKVQMKELFSSVLINKPAGPRRRIRDFFWGSTEVTFSRIPGHATPAWKDTEDMILRPYAF